MEKKHISVMGACVSRNLFNNELMKNIFTVDKYAFQVCLWDLFGPSLNLDEAQIEKLCPEKFTARMVCYDLNKRTISELETANSEYLILDFYNYAACPVEEFVLDDKKCYTENSVGRYRTLKNNLEKFNIKYNLYENKIRFHDPIQNGFKKLAEWIKTHYDLSKVIIFIPSFASKYYTIDNDLLNYPDSQSQYLINCLTKASEQLLSLLDNKAVLFRCDNIKSVAQFGVFDDITKMDIPPQMHLTERYYIAESRKLLTLLNLDDEVHKTDLELLDLESIKYRNMYVRTKCAATASTSAPAATSGQTLSLDKYFAALDGLENFVVIVSAKDEAASCLKSLNLPKELGLKMNLAFRDSYIAVVDKSCNFVYEQNSQESLEYTYFSNGKKIDVKSAGWLGGNLSSIKLEEKEISPAKRGLNIVLLNSKTLEVVDQAWCDSYLDKTLSVHSTYLDNIKIKT